MRKELHENRAADSAEKKLTSVSVIGLGNMGVALAGAFLKGGHPTTVWNRSSEKGDELVGKGAYRAQSLAEAVSASDVVVVCLTTYEVMHELFAPLNAEMKGKVLINLTTGTPERARQTLQWATERGIDYLDGAIMAIPPMIGAPDALIFYGGPKSVFDAHEQLLKQLGGNTTYLGPDTGVPLLYDLALLSMLYGAWYSYFHAHAMLSTANVTAAEFLPYASNWIQHLIVPLLTDPETARALDEGNHATEVSNMAVNRLGLENIVQSSEEMGISPDWLVPIHAIAKQMVEEGYGADAFTRVFEEMKRNGGHPHGK
ncbi:NAD(P)-dependent oxidoreductase [Brevibacillus choshinensis]|uniref:NAD(P)-dependent oxidoreductase n=1 Tax=Brevibacillus choshinensis TaxID=54911 RepID=A0ABX7FMC0_BRECH|nr:NAD(P)-binding domain-containing protein [Brevibacillus choshinensis]QRG66426.1 NAD(P)-dependent oxidoreductase [Brevibacillus choshinensis]